ncbi:MAG: suppressor of fused domain protein [Spirochaetales bacterium]|nr:suppressor of fused domain protein [Spirochaetales bacterium]
MSFFDRFKKKSSSTGEESPLGWDAITNEFIRIYPGQDNPKHYGTLISWEFGGNDPLQGISIYEDKDSFHFVTFGLSELYEKHSENKDISGYGMELTFRLKKGCYENEEDEIKCICGILQSIARITFTKGEIFKPFEYIYSGQKSGVDSEQKSDITGFITIPDVKANPLSTVNGGLSFVQLIGVKDTELQQVLNKENDVRGLYESLGSDITDYKR